MLKNIKSMFNDETEYFDTEILDENGTGDTNFDLDEVVNNSKSKSVVKIFEPINKSATQEITDSIIRGELCIVNFSKVSDEEATLIHSTLTGALYALDGIWKQVATKVIICAPKNFLVDGEDIV